METGSRREGLLGEPDREWLRERLSDFVDAYLYLLEKIAPYQDLVEKFADAVVEAAALTRRDVLEALLEALNQL